jgi:hypothetical protein
MTLKKIDCLVDTLIALRDEVSRPIVQCIYDYAAGDDAGPQVLARTRDALDDAGFGHAWVNDPVATQNFASLEAGFEVGLFSHLQRGRRPGFSLEGQTRHPRFEHALSSAPKGSIIYHNVAPRKDITAGTKNGEKFYVGVMPNNVLIVGPNSEFAYSFVRDELLFLAQIDCDDTGIQFRSRDLYPDELYTILAGYLDSVKPFESIEEADVAELPNDANLVIRIDNYGNVKLWTLPVDSTLADAKRLRVSINGTDTGIEALDTGEFTFAGGHGNLSFARGSSRINGKVFSELFLVGGNAACQLTGEIGAAVRSGDRVELTPVSA